jgi:transcriptional regulator with XRE-family HTH domain
MSEARKVRELRQEKGWSVEELAERSGVDEDIIRAIERDRWYREYDGMPYTPQENEIIGRLIDVFEVRSEGISIDNPPSLRPGDIVLGAEALDLLPQEVIEANADRVGIAVPDPETGELGLIRYNRLTAEDLERIAEYSERRRDAIESHKDRLLDHLSRMQEMGLERDESWREHEERRKEEDLG